MYDGFYMKPNLIAVDGVFKGILGDTPPDIESLRKNARPSTLRTPQNLSKPIRSSAVVRDCKKLLQDVSFLKIL